MSYGYETKVLNKAVEAIKSVPTAPVSGRPSYTLAVAQAVLEAIEADVKERYGLTDEIGGEVNPPDLSSRGFKHFESINSTPGYSASIVRVYESSAASEPCIWLAVDASDNPRLGDDLHAHLTLENATLLRDQLTYLIENHYQLTEPT